MPASKTTLVTKVVDFRADENRMKWRKETIPKILILVESLLVEGSRLSRFLYRISERLFTIVSVKSTGSHKASHHTFLLERATEKDLRPASVKHLFDLINTVFFLENSGSGLTYPTVSSLRLLRVFFSPELRFTFPPSARPPHLSL